MTDKDILFEYRLKQAIETLADAEKMLAGDFTTRSVTNRAYYSLFYSILALCIKDNVHITSSKHYGVISVFDKEFVKTGKFDKIYSEILHAMFDERQESDYVELMDISKEEAVENVGKAKQFVHAVMQYLGL